MAVFRRTRGESAGQAVLLSVVAISLVLAVVGATLFRSSVDNLQTVATSSGTGQVVESEAAQNAQSGVNATYQQLNTKTLKTTCVTSAPAVSATLGNGQGYAVTLTYYSTATAQSKVTCPAIVAGSNPESVELTSVGRAGSETMKMTSRANIAFTNPPPELVFGDSLYVDSSLSLSGADNFPGGTTRTLYVNGTLTCDGSAKVSETVVVLGNVKLSGSCDFTHDLTATGVITVDTVHIGSTDTTSSKRLERTALTSTSSTSPDIVIDPGSPVIGAIRAKTTVSYPTWWTPPTLTTTDTKSLTPPISQTFPTVTWTPAGWTSKGYAIVTAGSTCHAAYSAIYGTSSTTTKSVAVHTSCNILIPPTSATPSNCPTYEPSSCPDLTLNRNLAIVTTGGFEMDGASEISSVGSTTHDLTVVVPSGTTCTSGNEVVVTASGTIESHVDTLFYTPCPMVVSGAGNVAEGEIYAKSFAPTAGMAFGIPYTVPGSSNGTTLHPGLGTKTINILYERLQN